MTDVNLATLTLDNKAKFASVIETDDITSQFEMVNGLKNYATVNTAEPIPTQLPFNIGTENIEDGKNGETLNDTQMELESGSIITEIEDAGLNLYDLNSQQSSTVNNFDVDMFNNVFNSANLNKTENVNIISVKKLVHPQSNDKQDDLINMDKQIYTPEALQMSLACDEEIPSMWVDVMNYYNSNHQASVYQPSNDSQTVAIPTAVQSYLNLSPLQQNGGVGIQDCGKEFNNILENLTIDRPIDNTTKDVLKNLTAEADICKCVDCKCDSVNNCQNCDGHEKASEVKEQVVEESGSCCNGDKIVKNGSCGEGNKDDCCVVVCLKTLDQLRQMLNMANSCGGLQNLMLGCIKGGEFCAVQK